jgi:hypothetical protein
MQGSKILLITGLNPTEVPKVSTMSVEKSASPVDWNEKVKVFDERLRAQERELERKIFLL